MSKNLDQRLTYHCLDQIVGTHEHIMNSVLSNGLNENEIRNVCAKVSLPVFELLNDTVKLLGMKKRDFIEAAILGAIDRANEIMEETGLNDLRESGAVLLTGYHGNE